MKTMQMFWITNLQSLQIDNTAQTMEHIIMYRTAAFLSKAYSLSNFETLTATVVTRRHSSC